MPGGGVWVRWGDGLEGRGSVGSWEDQWEDQWEGWRGEDQWAVGR